MGPFLTTVVLQTEQSIIQILIQKMNPLNHLCKQPLLSLTAALGNTKLWVSILFTAIGLPESMTV